MDRNTNTQLLQLGFTQVEINNFEYIYNNGGKFTPMVLQSYGYSYEQAKRLAYLNKIMLGNVNISSENDMISHFKKMTGVSRDIAKQEIYKTNLANGYGASYSEHELINHLKVANGRQAKITIQDLAISKVTSVPRVAVVAGIIDKPYDIWNSKNYKGLNAMYLVTDVTGSKITVETSKKPKLEWGKAKEIPGVLEINGVKSDGKAVVTFNKRYCRLCNRFVIVASLRNPEFHLGKYNLICFEGTKVYVYAMNMGIKETVKHNMGNQRIYDYGILETDIRGKLDKVAKALYQQLGGVSANYMDATEDYNIIPRTEVEESFEDSEDEVLM